MNVRFLQCLFKTREDPAKIKVPTQRAMRFEGDMSERRVVNWIVFGEALSVGFDWHQDHAVPGCPRKVNTVEGYT
jgi:hypothetical protein